MLKKSIVLSDFDEAIDFIHAAEKCEFPVKLIRQGDISEYNGKSTLSVMVLIGWNIDVLYQEENKRLEDVLMKYRITSQKTGWRDYVMKQGMEDAIRTGQGTIDSQHLHMIRYFNYLADACEHGNSVQAEKLISVLSDYMVFHFASEERLQRNSGYGDVESHRSQHQELKNALRSLQEKLGNENADLRELSDYIYKEFFPLFFEHIRLYDLDLCRYLVRHPVDEE